MVYKITGLIIILVAIMLIVVRPDSFTARVPGDKLRADRSNEVNGAKKESDVHRSTMRIRPIRNHAEDPFSDDHDLLASEHTTVQSISIKTIFV